MEQKIPELQIAIVVIAYNRVDSLNRLLGLLGAAFYDGHAVDLVISIDKSDLQDRVVLASESFSWKYGRKKIRTFEERQGLRKHVLQCGDLVEHYDAVIVLEDDIIVARNFYIFASEAVQKFKEQKEIAGIALYTPAINVMNGRPFAPLQTNADTFLMQVAQSWGQCWTKTMWKDFRLWYAQNESLPLSNRKLPQKVVNWPASSWLKYYMSYLVETEKYFVYPYVALASNSSEKGEHNRSASHAFQVSMLLGQKSGYQFAEQSTAVCYDVYFELKHYGGSEINGVPLDEICVDLYGIKATNGKKKFLLSVRSLPFRKICSFVRNRRPHDVNVINPLPGQDIVLYSLDENTALRSSTRSFSTVKYFYGLSWKDAIVSAFAGFFEAIFQRIGL